MKTTMPLPDDESREFLVPAATWTHNPLALSCRDVPIFQAMNAYEPNTSSTSSFRRLWLGEWTRTT